MSNLVNVINISMGIIYKTTNLQNGKIYIGKAKTNNPMYLGSGSILREAIKKYGRSMFLKEILEECDDCLLDEREVFWISKFDSTNRSVGYNITKGGTGGDTTSQHPNKNNIIEKRGTKIKQWHKSLSESERNNRAKKISESKKGKSNGHTGFRHSEETKKLISENQPNKTLEWKKLHEAAMLKRRGVSLKAKFKPVIVNGTEYPSIHSAMKSLDIKHRATFYNRIKRGIIQIEYK